ncbi:MAG: pimeloyl-ACP methyl ester carboxylesterase [Salibacteraceae bacterium]|jgi:pimeloyl-ACP methyl ester carboxylesterase
MEQFIKPYFKTLSVISPNLAAKSAFEMFKKVRKKEIRTREKPFYEESISYKIPYKNEDIDCYAFGNPTDNIVVLVHGWDSNVGSMYKFIQPLLTQNKYIIGFNLPGHAFYTGSKTHLFEAKESFKVFMQSLPKGRKIDVISHSFGSAVTAFGLSEMDLKVNKLLFLTSPNRIEDIFIDYKNFIGLGEKAFINLKERAHHVLNEPLNVVNVETRLNLVDFHHLYLLHDRLDKIIPYTNSVKINESINKSTLISFHKLGHYKMLWNDELINKAMAILKEE